MSVKKKRAKKVVVSPELVEELTKKVRANLLRRAGRVVPVRVKFKPEDWKVYTYLAPKDHGLVIGQKVLTPTGAAIVESLDPADYDETVSYKRLRGKYALLRFDYGDGK